MRTWMNVMLAAVLVASVAMPAMAAEVTYSGSLMCAKCMLQKPDAHECQDVLIVTDAKGAKTEYYVTKNEVAAAAGDAATNENNATVTGTVSEKDGRKWITATRIEKQKS
jgi:aspartate 1-decarboxylase